MNQPTLQQSADAGANAAQVLENPAFGAAWESMRAEIVEAWSNADMRDTEGQQLLLQQMKLLGRLRGKLAAMVEGGKFALAKISTEDLARESAARRLVRRVF